jgi:hypothetical protein
MVGALALAVPAASAAPRDVEVPSKGLRYGKLQRAVSGPCKGRFEMTAAAGRGGPARCSHGPDAAPEGVDVRIARGPEDPAITAAVRPTPVSQAEGTLCTGDGASGPRVQLVYASVTGKPDRFATFADSFQLWAAAMDSVFNVSAGETGGGRRIRFVHDAACKPTISRVTLSSAAESDFDTTINELWAKGFNRNDRKYLVWTDANVYCGIGEVYNDDRPGQSNNNNVYGTFARVDNGCWGLVGQSVEAHELMHNLGGVQQSAPHATTFNHCTDDRDRMCYADGSGATLTQVCPAAHENVFDCNHDDYFHTAPAAGSYLATHWNPASSAWLTATAATTLPSAPLGVGAVPGEGLATLTWSTPTSDGGFPVTGYVVTPYDGATARTPQTFTSPATTQTLGGLTNETAYTFKVAAVNAVGTGPQSAASATVTPTAGSRFNSLPPARLLDTRNGTGAPVAKVPAGASIDLQVTGGGGVPAAGVSAVVLNVTVVDPDAGGYLTAWPTGEARPWASNLNFTPGQTVPNLVVVKVGDAGRVSLYNGGGAVHLVADVAGWYGASAASAGSRYHPLAPARLLDTRAGLGAVLARVASAGTLDLQVAGQGGVPSTGVSAVVLNVTVTDTLGGGFLTAWPTGDPRPLASNLNFALGQTVPNLVVVKVGTSGKVSFYNGGGGLNMIADVAGWFGPGGEATGARYHPVAPARLLDTRAALGAPLAAVAPGAALDLQVTGRGGVPATGVSAVILNVTVVDPMGGGFLTAWPTGDARPWASNLNFAAGQTVPNLVVAKLGTGGKVSLYNGGGATHLVADVAGWYGAG